MPYSLEQKEAYADGYAAAQRTGKWKDYLGFNPPENPHGIATPQHFSWDQGFEDGTEDLIAWRSLD